MTPSVGLATVTSATTSSSVSMPSSSATTSSTLPSSSAAASSSSTATTTDILPSFPASVPPPPGFGTVPETASMSASDFSGVPYGGARPKERGRASDYFPPSDEDSD